MAQRCLQKLRRRALHQIANQSVSIVSCITCLLSPVSGQLKPCSPSNTNTPHQLRFLDLSPTITAAANWPTPNPATAPTRAYWTTPSGPSNSCGPNTAHGGHGARAGWLGLTLGYNRGRNRYLPTGLLPTGYLPTGYLPTGAGAPVLCLRRQAKWVHSTTPFSRRVFVHFAQFLALLRSTSAPIST
jgi:hypothetical protein